MQELEKRYEIARLIACELIGVLSGREAEDLEVWKNSSEKHAREYMEIRERLLRDIDYPDYLELKQEWEGFEQKLFRKKRVFNWWVTVAAACVVICLGITFLWMREPVAEPVVAGTSGGTKGFRATLILGNGEQVSIGDSSSQTIAVAGGTTIVTTGKMVKYDAGKEDREEKAEWNTIVVPRGGEYELVLADGTRVWLNSESRLTYPVRFTGELREVKMEGEICFDVARKEEQPFVVRTADLAVKVLGTLFNMEAYPEDSRVTTTLVRGKVEVAVGDKTQVLQPDQQLAVEAGRFTLKQVVAEDYIGWTNGLFHFTEASLEEIMTKLARWYAVEFFFAKPDLKEAHFSLDIQRYENIATILSKLEKTGRARFRVSGKTVVIEQ